VRSARAAVARAAVAARGRRAWQRLGRPRGLLRARGFRLHNGSAVTVRARAGGAPVANDDGVWLACIECGDAYAPFETVRYTCDCGCLLEARYADLPTFEAFEGRGVWRYAAALPFEEGVSLSEGDTPLHPVPDLEAELGVEALRVKHEGMNPTGAFKDRGMTVGVRVAQELGVDRLACASTGNTSAGPTLSVLD